MQIDLLNDINIKCRDCKMTFLFSIEEQKFFQSLGFEEKPTRCPICRKAHRNIKREKNRIDLRDCIGQYVTRTKTPINGDRSFLNRIIKCVDVRLDGTIIYRYPIGTFIGGREDMDIHQLPPLYNDGYWKIVNM